MADRKKIAAIVTMYFPYSHSDVIVTKFLKGFHIDDGIIPPRTDIVSMRGGHQVCSRQRNR